MEYVLPLTPADTGSTRRMTTLHIMLAFVLCGIGAGCLVLYWFTSVSPKFTSAYRPFALLGSLSLLVGLLIAGVAFLNKKWLMEGKRSLWLRAIELAVIVSAGAIFALAGQWRPAGVFGIIGLAVIVAAIWESRKSTPQQAVIAEGGITVPKGGFTKSIHWKEIEQVLLRHGILSIELTGNRLVQRSIIQDGSIDASTIESFSNNLIRQYEKERAAAAAW